MQELIRKENVVDLKLKIKNLENQITYSSRMIAKESKTKTKAMVKYVMIENGLTEKQAFRKVYDETGKILSVVEMESWSEEKLQFYKNSIGTKAFDNMVNQIGVECNDDMDGEVAKDISGIAQFLTQDVLATWNVKGMCNTLKQNEEWVLNTTDSCKGCRIAVGWDPFVISASLLAQSDQVMHLSVRSLLDDKLMYVSVIYKEISPKTRAKLWRNLCDHMSIAGNEPWVLLGDFNVILKSNENSNGLNVRSEGTQDFKECFDCLGIVDINISGLFYTWIQKIKNPKLGVSKKLDRIMGNSQFINSFPASFTTFMPYLSSDHCPCVLTLPDLPSRKPRPFRFMNFLADKK
ncbi:ribonuclease H-like domain-containing protein [Tanacetum coccineum]|uniref:Ribonuclease H-like domain-containing protein n=1 Tax=Tanacetum coccineum TaxID=301880 RepID=A0ABQ5ES08_9ASTR